MHFYQNCCMLLASALVAVSIRPEDLFAAADGDFFEGDGTVYDLGAVSSGNCNLMAANSGAGVNYAALNDKQWDNLQHCGRCAQVSCNDDRCKDKSVSQVVQIVDRCPECELGALDLSPTVFEKITGVKRDRYKIKWKFVDCPIQGNVKYCLKGGSNNFWTAIQPTNVVSGVKSMKVNGKATTMVDSAYYYLLDGKSQEEADLSSLKITLTSIDNEVIEDTVSLTPGSCATGSSQFPVGSSRIAVGNPVHVTAFANQTDPTPAPTPTATPVPSPSTTQASPSPAATPLSPQPSVRRRKEKKA